MGRYDDLIPSNNASTSKSSSNRYSDLIPGKPVEKTENVFKRALSAVAKPIISSTTEMASGIANRNPMQFLGGFSKGGAAAAYEGLSAGKHELLSSANKAMFGDNFASSALTFGGDVASDPLTWTGGKLAVQGAKKVSGSLFKGEGAKEAFRDRLFKIMQGKFKRETAIYGRKLDESLARVDLSDIVEDGANKTLREAQEIKNAITEGIPEAVKSGVKISSKYVDSGSLAKTITDRMKAADKTLAPVMERYGQKANDFRQAIGQFKPSTAGSEHIYGSPTIIGFKSPFLGGSGAREATKRFAPKVFNAAKKERRGENMRRLGQAALVGVPASYAASKLVPSIFKQATRRFTEGL